MVSSKLGYHSKLLFVTVRLKARFTSSTLIYEGSGNRTNPRKPQKIGERSGKDSLFASCHVEGLYMLSVAPPALLTLLAATQRDVNAPAGTWSCPGPNTWCR